MKRRILMFLMFVVGGALLSGRAYAAELNLFDADIGKDLFTVNKIVFETPDSVEDEWYPLRAAAEYLPIHVEWDEDSKSVVVESEAIRLIRPLCSTRYYDQRALDAYCNDIKTVNGITYCSGRFLVQHLQGVSFLYGSAVFCYSGTGESSDYVRGAGSARFVPYVNAALYELYLKSPKDYEMIKTCLTGGIQYMPFSESPYCDAVGFVYSRSEKPVCYIVGDGHTGATMASLVAHEAMHVYQTRNGNPSSETEAKQYEQAVLRRVLQW